MHVQYARRQDVAVLDFHMKQIILIVCPECDNSIDYIFYGRGYSIDDPTMKELQEVRETYPECDFQAIHKKCSPHGDQNRVAA